MANQKKKRSGISRRQLLGRGAGVTGAALLGASTSMKGSAQSTQNPGGQIYRNIGVHPIINCKGTYTILSGSLTLPAVKTAMEEASRYYVHIEELMEGVSTRLAQLTGADWGIVTAGCSAAETLATCACIAGGDPEKIQRVPDLDGLRDEVIIPDYSRNVYDHAVRMVGVKLVEVSNPSELQNAFGPRTAMVYILACPDDTGPLGLSVISAEAKKHGVPVFVDAAAENLTPEVHLERGADLVGYSGGKALRGPQCAGLLLGREDLCRAAWINSAPHHAFGRSMKVGKEEMMGMLAAVEAWYQRDHKAEWRKWESWLNQVRTVVEGVDGIGTEILQPDSLSNSAPQLKIAWDASRLRIGGAEVDKIFFSTEPRIALAWGRGSVHDEDGESSVGIMPWMMQPGDAAVVAERLEHLLHSPPSFEAPEMRKPASVAGTWKVAVQFQHGRADHTLLLEQEGASLKGMHLGEELRGRLTGRVNGNQVEIYSSQPYEGTTLRFNFTGELRNDQLTGTVAMGEYGVAEWKGVRT